MFAKKRNDKCRYGISGSLTGMLFAGCSTGNLRELSYRHRTDVVAETLADVFNCKVNAYGADNTIENKEILHRAKLLRIMSWSSPEPKQNALPAD
jgi:hypothetical protein